MLETVREYGLEQLTASGEDPAARRAHADWYSPCSKRPGATCAEVLALDWLPASTTIATICGPLPSWLDQIGDSNARLRRRSPRRPPFGSVVAIGRNRAGGWPACWRTRAVQRAPLRPAFGPCKPPACWRATKAISRRHGPARPPAWRCPARWVTPGARTMRWCCSATPPSVWGVRHGDPLSRRGVGAHRGGGDQRTADATGCWAWPPLGKGY